jgi:hypothetical protein
VHFKGRTESIEFIVGELFKNFSYRVRAYEVVVSGERLAIVLTERIAQSILDGIKLDYHQENLNITDYEFVETVSVGSVWVDRSEVMERGTAESELRANRTVEKFYRVQSGDTLSAIGSELGVSAETLLNLNPQLEGDPTRLRAGADIVISASEPRLHVRTRELVEYQKPLPFPREERTTDARPRSEPARVIQQGRDGAGLIREYIVRVNGLEVRREAIETIVLEEPVTEITEVGTG